MTDRPQTADKAQVPKHVLRVFSDEGGQEKVEIQVLLPGVSSASQISVQIEPPDTVHVRVPDRYRLHLKLAVPIAAQADTVRFKSRTGRLTMNCLVISPEQEADIPHANASTGAAVPDDTTSAAQADQQPGQSAHAGAGAEAVSETALHAKFTPAQADQQAAHTQQAAQTGTDAEQGGKADAPSAAAVAKQRILQNRATKPCSDRLATLKADAVASVDYLSSTEALKPAAIKLLLASCTGAGVWLVLGMAWQLLWLAWWLLCFAWQLLCMAWWLAVMAGGMAWWLLCWPWVNLVWRPKLTYQVIAVTCASLSLGIRACLHWCGVFGQPPTGAPGARITRISLNLQMAFLQVIVSGGPLTTVASFMVSILWLHHTTHLSSNEAGVQQQVQAPWWHASMVGMATPLACCELSSLAAGWLLDVPTHVVVARAALIKLMSSYGVGWLLFLGIITGVAGFVTWLIRQDSPGGYLCLFAVWAAGIVLNVLGGSGVWEGIARLAAAVVALCTGLLGFLLPAIRLCEWLAFRAIGALAWLFKPHLHLATAMLHLTLLHLVPLPLLDRVVLGLCVESKSPLMQKVCSFLGHVQLAARAQASTPAPNPWWMNMLLCVVLLATVASLIMLQGMQEGNSNSMRLAGWISDASKMLTGIRWLFRRRPRRLFRRKQRTQTQPVVTIRL